MTARRKRNSKKPKRSSNNRSKNSESKSKSRSSKSSKGSKKTRSRSQKSTRGNSKKRSASSGSSPKRGGRSNGPQRERRKGKRDRRQTIDSSIGAQELVATFDKNFKGFGFLVFDNKDLEDVFVPQKYATGYLHGDRLKVQISDDGEIENIEIHERRSKELVGIYQPHPSLKQSGHLTYRSKKAFEEIPLVSRPNARGGDWIRARLVYPKNPSSPGISAEVIEVYGKDLPASADITMVIGEFALYEEHSKEAVEQALSLEFEIDPEEDRIDLREVPLITIDGETARDFDDAVYVEKNGNDYKLFVAIADVSNYVTPDSPIDVDAQKKATSVYFPERAFHMLPSELSENLCSLKPNEDRLALVCEIHFDHEAAIKEIDIYNGVIKSHRRATYTEIQNEYEENGSNSSWEFKPHFELFDLLRKKRIDRGSIEFELPEAFIDVDESGEPVSIEVYQRKESHRLIEEFMIAANEAVTEWALDKKIPFLYRVHDVPSAESIEKFESLARSVGLNLNLKGASQSPKVLAEIAKQIESHPASVLLNMMLLRSMKQAIYSESHDGHYGLASLAYTHFTSPIRRYPDLVVHRILKTAIRYGEATARSKFDENELGAFAQHSSHRERLADQAERLSHKVKHIRLMMKHIGEEFEGTIQGMNSRGIFVQLLSPFVEGFIAKERLGGDLYTYQEDKMIYIGNRTRKAFRVGDRLTVKVARASLESREIEFELVSHQGVFDKKQNDDETQDE